VQTKDARFAADEKVQKLKFSPRWIYGLLKRHALRRRRITAAEKVLPEPAVVQTRMEEIQGTITHEGRDDQRGRDGHLLWRAAQEPDRARRRRARHRARFG